MYRSLLWLSILLSLVTATLVLVGCNGDDDDNDAADDDSDDDNGDDDTVDDDTTDIYEDACTNYATQYNNWAPVSDTATFMGKFLGFTENDEFEMLIDGQNLHLRVPSGSAGACWMNLPAGSYTATLSIDGVDRDTLEFDLVANTVSMAVNVKHEVNGPDMAYFPVDVTAPDGQWSLNVLNFTQDVKPTALDVYLWPIGTTSEDYKTLTPDRIASNVSYGSSVAVDITPAFSPYGVGEDVVPSMVFTVIPAGSTLDVNTVIPELFLPCYSSIEDPTFSATLVYATCADDSTEDDPNGFCYQQGGNGGTSLFYPGEACF